jgi:hypothetical protein
MGTAVLCNNLVTQKKQLYEYNLEGTASKFSFLNYSFHCINVFLGCIKHLLVTPPPAGMKINIGPAYMLFYHYAKVIYPVTLNNFANVLFSGIVFYPFIHYLQLSTSITSNLAHLPYI